MDRQSRLSRNELLVLRLLSDGESPVDKIATAMQENEDTAFGYCLLLSDRGLLERVSHFGFRITERGKDAIIGM